MPPKAKITKEMVIDAAFEVAHETGAENINARTVAKNCIVLHSLLCITFLRLRN